MHHSKPRHLVRCAGCRLLPALFLFLVSCSSGDTPKSSGPPATATQPNTLSKAEKAGHWRLLFDGKTFSGWSGLGRETVPEGHWIIESGAIKKVESGEVPVQADGQPLAGGDLMTVDTFENFELEFEWRVSPGANSGVKYNVSEAMSTASEPRYAALGFEYQVLDDDRHADAVEPAHRAAALYDLIPAQNKTLKPVGEFNQARIVFNGTHGEHWLNGVKVLEFDLTSSDFAGRFAASKYAKMPNFLQKRKGHIVLQDHSDAVWFRNIKIRDLSAAAH